MRGGLTARRLLVAAVVVPLAAVAAAVFTQLRYDMQPCPWCVLQRMVFVAIAVAALVALSGNLLRLRSVQKAAAGLTLVLAACGAAAALWQHFVAGSSTSCNLTLADRIVRGSGLDELWPLVFSAYASCADAAARLLGVPFEFYSLALFIALGVAAWVALRRAR